MNYQTPSLATSARKTERIRAFFFFPVSSDAYVV